LREDVTLEDMERSLKDREAADKAAKDQADAETKIKLEAKLRAESEDPQIRGLQEALRISEEARKRVEDLAAAGRAPAPKKEDELPKLTREQLAELHQRDPLAAIEYMQADADRRLSENLERRLAPLISGGSTTAREAARAKYPDEFELFGGDIEKMLSDPRVSRDAMSQPQAWEDMIAYVRGRSGNFEKLVEHRASKDKDKAARDAQAREAASAGAHTRTDVRPPAPASGVELDAVEKEIAKAIHSNLSEEDAYREYRRYKGVAR